MSIKKWLKLMLGIILVSATCFGLVVYENNAIASVGASSASIVLPTYSVGSEYSGLVSQQFVNVGDSVAVGQKLFELTSDQITAALASKQLTLANLNYTPASDGGFIISAHQSGVVSQINNLKGSFVSAGTSIAVISSTSVASVRANFELSGPEYAKLQPNTAVSVSFGGKSMAGTITSISQQSVGGHTFTIVTASLPAIGSSQTVYTSGTPASAKLVFSTQTYYQQLLTKAHSLTFFGHVL